MFSKLKVTARLESLKGQRSTLEREFDAFELLALLQQVLPGSTCPPNGKGTKVKPWKPTTPQHWFYCAKVCAIAQRQALYGHIDPKKEVHGNNEKKLQAAAKALSQESKELRDAVAALPTVKQYDKQDKLLGDTKGAWLQVGGRYILITTGNLYSSDYGDTTPIPKHALFSNSSYPTLWSELDKDKGWSNDGQLTQEFRKVLKGQSSKVTILPLMGSVLFVSEVARNHTALHTNLMAADLISAGKFNNTSMDPTQHLPLTWKVALWYWQKEDVGCLVCGGTGSSPTDSCLDCAGTGSLTCAPCGGNGCQRPLKQCGPCGGKGNIKGGECRTCYGLKYVNCIECRGYGGFRHKACKGSGKGPCARCEGKGKVRKKESDPRGLTNNTAQGGLNALQGGLLPMSHTGSAWGSASDLAGKGDYFGAWQNKPAPEAFDDLPTLSIVRRKEATILIRWLSLALKKYEKIVKQQELLTAWGLKSLSFETQVLASNYMADDDTGGKAYALMEELATARSQLSHAEELQGQLVSTRKALTSINQGLRGASTTRYSFHEAADKQFNDAQAQLAKNLDEARQQLLKEAQWLSEEKARLETEAEVPLQNAMIPLVLFELLQKRLDSFDSLL